MATNKQLTERSLPAKRRVEELGYQIQKFKSLKKMAKRK